MKVEVKEFTKKQKFFIANDGTAFLLEKYCSVYEKFECNIENIFEEYFHFNSHEPQPWKIRDTLCFAKREVPNEVIGCLHFLNYDISFGGLTIPKPNVLYRVVNKDEFETVDKAQKIRWVEMLQKEIEEIEEFEKEMNR